MNAMRRLVVGGFLAALVPVLAVASSERSSELIQPAQSTWQAPAQQAPTATPALQLQAQQQHGQHCATQVGVCVLNVPGPLGFPCTCMFSLGPVPGRIVP